mmetsp:Transcript_25723/g.57840  ORF Transcript_25723/g.57840 Transcript_25723/m.57840 type:complete len:250 (-) Transcript_25723:1114-1863(-)
MTVLRPVNVHNVSSILCLHFLFLLLPHLLLQDRLRNAPVARHWGCREVRESLVDLGRGRKSLLLQILHSPRRLLHLTLKGLQTHLQGRSRVWLPQACSRQRSHGRAWSRWRSRRSRSLFPLQPPPMVPRHHPWRSVERLHLLLLLLLCQLLRTELFELVLRVVVGKARRCEFHLGGLGVRLGGPRARPPLSLLRLLVALLLVCSDLNHDLPNSMSTLRQLVRERDVVEREALLPDHLDRSFLQQARNDL